MKRLILLHTLLFSLVAHAILDTNNNGLSDLWEKQYNDGQLFSPTNLEHLPNADPDLDGWDNRTEAAAGTDPSLANPPEGIVATTLLPSATAGAYTLTWPTRIGKRYQLQASTDLESWLPVGNPIIAENTSHSIGINVTEPGSPIPPKLFWHITIDDIDSDSDGLTNNEEHQLATDPNAPDSDGDTLWDYNEALAGTDPNNQDTDADGASDSIEFTRGSDPKSADSVPPCDPDIVAVARLGHAKENDFANGDFTTSYLYRKSPGSESITFDSSSMNLNTLQAGVQVLSYPSLEAPLLRLPIAEFRGLPATEWEDGTKHYGPDLNVYSFTAQLSHPYGITENPSKEAVIYSQNLQIKNQWKAPEDTVYRFLKIHLKAPMPVPPFGQGETLFTFQWNIPASSYTVVSEDTEVVELKIAKGEKDSSSYELEAPAAEPGIYHLVGLLLVEFKKMWETPNKANQIVVEARRDDPASTSQQPDSQDNLYGAPRNVLFIAADPADEKYHVSINIAAGMRDHFVAAAYKANSKISGTDKAFPSAEDQPADMIIPATGNSQSGEDYVIKVAYDSNKNGLIDNTETAIELEALNNAEGTSLAPMVRGFSTAAVTAADSTIQGQAFGNGWTGWKPNWVGGFFVPNAIALEKLFYTGNAGQLDAPYVPTVTLPDASLNAFGPVGDFNEWLTHNTGVQFDSEGIASIKHYQWAADTRISNLIAASTPLSTLKDNDNIVVQMQSETTSTVNAYKQAGVPAGQAQVFPNVNGYDLQSILTSLGKPHWSPLWVPKQTLLIGNEDGYAGAIPDDAFGTVGRSRFLSGKYWFVVKKENRIDYESIPDAPAQEHPYTAIVVYLRISGISQDLYDFNHNAGGLSIPAAITQLSYGNGSYGRSHGIIFRTSVNILNDYEMQEIRLP